MLPSEKVEGTEHMRSRLLYYIDKIGDPPNSHKLVLKMFCYEWKKMKELKEIDEEIDKIPASAPPDKRRMLNNKRNEVVNSIKVHKRRSSRAHKEESDMLKCLKPGGRRIACTMNVYDTDLFLYGYTGEKYPTIIMENVENGNLLDKIRNEGKMNGKHYSSHCCRTLLMLLLSPWWWCSYSYHFVFLLSFNNALVIHNIEQHVSSMLEDIAKALMQLHTNGIIHRDIKPENICYRMSEVDAVLIDFGESVKVQSLTRPNASTNSKIFYEDKKNTGTLGYMAPESYTDKHSRKCQYSDKSDIFSLGIVFYIMLMGHHPYDQAKSYDLDMMRDQITSRPINKLPGRSELANDLLLKMVHLNPAERPSAADILKHGFIKQYTTLPNADFGEDYRTFILRIKRFKKAVNAIMAVKNFSRGGKGEKDGGAAPQEVKSDEAEIKRRRKA